MTIQHKNIANDQLHEPKDVNSAVANTAYFANGTGSGVWKKVGTETLAGLSGDGNVANLKLLTTGSGGQVKLVRDGTYGKMTIVDNAVPFAITAAADPTLETGSQYVLLTGSGTPFVNGTSDGVVFDTNKLTFTYAGVYDINFWSNITGFPSNTAKVAVRFRMNGTAVSPMHVWCKSNSNGDSGILAASDFITVAAGDYIQLMGASDATGNIVFHNMNLTAKMMKAL